MASRSLQLHSATEGASGGHRTAHLCPSDGARSLSPHIPQDSRETEPASTLQNGQHRCNSELCPFPRSLASVLDLDLVFVKQFGLKDPSLIRTQGLINGRWVDGEDGRTIAVTSSVLLPTLPDVFG